MGVAYASGVQMPILDEYIERLKITLSIIYEDANKTFHDNFKDVFDKADELKKHIPDTNIPSGSQ